ncbi:ABC transporter ATP-binding protein [Polynucleobacter sp. IMCC 29146]|uniref:ABC transporter ATP-binding protein n=1 Tax=Polynucleobacter sp. IMCC 29146 TaxID=2780953 RepID=UPI001F47A2EC|nr:ABC transporter ATP-binding protein [Polynucleobacter sp. IMCC 29146]MCE7528669.1 ABC transporter ATP-binding protein [Polynucleobacter sp. IMCC 29146]
MIKIENLVKQFGKVDVLKGINLEFPEKEFITLVGPSGCGKTTLLRIIAGLDDPTSGEIFFNNKAITGLSPRERNIAMVFQSYALYPHLDVAGNLGYALKLRGIKKADIAKRVLEVAKVLEIEMLLDRKPKALSGGQRQRVALGRAMVRKPDLFLMDEPLSNLDAKLRTSMRSELKRFHFDLGVTTIYVTHDQLEAMSMSDRIAVFDGGVVQQFGTPMDIYRRPNNLFVAEFIGSPPMNFIKNLEIADGKIIFSGSKKVLCHLPRAYSHLMNSQLCILGVRPQDIQLASIEQSEIKAQIDLIQLLGANKLVDLSFSGEENFRLSVEMPAELVCEQGINVGIQFSIDQIHLFDPISLQNLVI